MKIVLIRSIASLFFVAGITGCANPAAGEFKKNYLLDFGDQSFSFDVSLPPDNEYIKFKNKIPYKDAAIYLDGSRSASTVDLTWLYKRWPFGLYDGMTKLYMTISKSNCNSGDVDCLKNATTNDANYILTESYKRPSVEIKYTEILIAGRKWLKYNYPLGMHIDSYSTFISNNIYLSFHVHHGTFQFEEEAMLVEKIIKSMKFNVHLGA